MLPFEKKPDDRLGFFLLSSFKRFFLKSRSRRLLLSTPAPSSLSDSTFSVTLADDFLNSLLLSGGSVFFLTKVGFIFLGFFSVIAGEVDCILFLLKLSKLSGGVRVYCLIVIRLDPSDCSITTGGSFYVSLFSYSYYITDSGLLYSSYILSLTYL